MVKSFFIVGNIPTEGNMATLELKDCRELVIFRALTENNRFLDACKMLMEFDKTHSERKILRKPQDKDILRRCFEECRQALRIAFPHGEKMDVNNVSHLNRFKNVFNQQLPKRCQKHYDDFVTPFRGRIKMGEIFSEHMAYIDRAGLSYYKSLISEQKREESQRVYEQVRVDSFRPLEHGYEEKGVFSKEKTYKPVSKVLYDRFLQERKSKGVG